MTIKPVPNQKTNEKNKDNLNNHSQEQQIQNVRTNVHRNVIGNKGNVEHGQSPQRRSDNVYDDLNSRHRRSPHKSGTRSKRNTTSNDSHHKRNNEQSKHQTNSVDTTNVLITKSPKHNTNCGNIIGVNTNAVSNNVNQVVNNTLNSNNTNDIINVNNVVVNTTNQQQSQQQQTTNQSQQQQQQQQQLNNQTSIIEQEIEDILNGYNSGDEHLVPKDSLVTLDEWEKRDKQFIKTMKERGYILKSVAEDGACLFRAISLQIYGDEDMHEVIREQTMDYIFQNREYFAHFVTEDIDNYVQRKRNKDAHGNHIEIQAISEIYNRRVELYCYETTPSNIFYSQQTNNNSYEPLRLSYQRGSHYNAIIDPYSASVGVGLGLSGYKPESQTREAIKLSEQQEIEQAMFEDKLKTTDWEATNEAIEEQIARESYLQWCRDNMKRCHMKCGGGDGDNEDGERSIDVNNLDRENIRICGHNNYTISCSSSSSSTGGKKTTSTSSSTSANNYFNIYGGGGGACGAVGTVSNSTITSATEIESSSTTVTNLSNTTVTTNINLPSNICGSKNQCNIPDEISGNRIKTDNTDKVDIFLNDNKILNKNHDKKNTKEYCDKNDDIKNMSSTSSIMDYHKCNDKMKRLKSTITTTSSTTSSAVTATAKTSKGNLLYYNLQQGNNNNNNINNNNNNIYNNNNNNNFLMRNSKRLKRKIKDLTTINSIDNNKNDNLQLNNNQLHNNTQNFINTNININNNNNNEQINMKRSKSTITTTTTTTTSSTTDNDESFINLFNIKEKLQSNNINNNNNNKNNLIISNNDINKSTTILSNTTTTTTKNSPQSTNNYDFFNKNNKFLSQTDDNKQNDIQNIIRINKKCDVINDDDDDDDSNTTIQNDIKNSTTSNQIPSTSKEITEPVSKFYQSLLESSYTDDGVRQLTEMEMINKAIQMSRIDYIEDQRVKYGLNNYQNHHLPQNDNDDDST